MKTVQYSCIMFDEQEPLAFFFLFFLLIWNQQRPATVSWEREKGVDIDRLASFRSFSLLHLLSPASSCLSNRNWFQLSVLKVVSIPKMHLEDRGETGRSGGATNILLFTVFFRTKNCLIKKVVPLTAGTTNHRVRQNNLKLYSALCCCCSDCIPRQLLKSELKVNKTRSSCA